MPAHPQHTCVRFKQTGELRLGHGSIVKGETVMQFSVDNVLWQCRDCRKTVWLARGIDPNVEPAKTERVKR